MPVSPASASITIWTENVEKVGGRRIAGAIAVAVGVALIAYS